MPDPRIPAPTPEVCGRVLVSVTTNIAYFEFRTLHVRNVVPLQVVEVDPWLAMRRTLDEINR